MYNKKQIEVKIIGHITKKGNKFLAYKLWENVLLLIKKRFFLIDPWTVIQQALENLKPVVTIIQRKKGGINYKIPIVVRSTEKKDNRILLAIRWLISNMHLRSEKLLSERLANEIIDTFNKTSLSYKNKLEIYKTAVKNRVFSKFLK